MKRINQVAVTTRSFLSSLTCAENLSCHMVAADSQPVPTDNTTWKPRQELTDAWAVMTFSASETMSAADFCSSPPSALCDCFFFLFFCCCSFFLTAPLCSSHTVGVDARAVAVCSSEFNKAGVGDEVTGLQAIRLIQSANIRSLLADIS